MIVEIEVKNVYGILTVYPVNETAKVFAEIANTKTLTHTTLCHIEKLGYEINEVVTPKILWKSN